VEHSHKLLRGIHKRDDTVYPRDFLLVPVDLPFDFYIPAGQRWMVETAEHKATLDWDCPDIVQLHLPGTWAFPYSINHLMQKPQLELASAVKRKEVEESCAWMEDPCKDPAEVVGTELDNNANVLNNTNSATTPCTLGMNMPKLMNDCGTNLADKAALLNNKHTLAGPVNLNVQANGTCPKRVPTTQTTSRPVASLDCYLVYTVNACQDAVTQIHHCLSTHTTIFHAYYVTHTAGLHC
jgi:hypothetical protein